MLYAPPILDHILTTRAAHMPRRTDQGSHAMDAKNRRADFQWEDALLLEDQLTEEERMVRDTARDYAQDKLMPRVLEANRHEKFDREIMNELGALGLLGSTIDGYGCAGTNYVSYRSEERRVGKGCDL